MASEWVSILVDGQDMRVYESQPETPSKVPGVIVIMEVFGVNKHIQEVTDRFSREGCVAVAPVLYHRVGSNPLFSYMGDATEARTKAMGSLSDSELTRDLNATIGYLKSHSQVRADHLGIVGFCVGARIAYLAATSRSTLAPITALIAMSARAIMLRPRKTPGHERSVGFSNT